MDHLYLSNSSCFQLEDANLGKEKIKRCRKQQKFSTNAYGFSHGRWNYQDSGDVSPPFFGKFSGISKNIRQRSLRQTVQKLQLIMIFDFCKALLLLAMKVLGFSININSYLAAISILDWFHPKLQWVATTF